MLGLEYYGPLPELTDYAAYWLPNRTRRVWIHPLKPQV
jgi:hypothetical protein